MSPRTLLLAIRLIAALLVIASWPPHGVSAQEAPIDITSEAYIVLNADTGEIYAERNMHEPLAPASLTKIFTTIEAIEAAPGSTVIVTDEADMVDWEATQVGFGPGETFTLTDLLYGMMVPSGNDAARAVARALGTQEGDSPAEGVSRFMERMNTRIQSMGLTDTTLVNPDGWGVDGHRSSAYDIATFTMYALQYPRFLEAISAPSYEMPGGYQLTNTNKRIDAQPDLIGSKTGYDDTAGYCLMQVARQGGTTIIAVTLNGAAPDYWYDDNRALLDYGFEQSAARAPGGGSDLQVARFLDPDAPAVAALAQPEARVFDALPVSAALGGEAHSASMAAASSGIASTGALSVVAVVVATFALLATGAIRAFRLASSGAPTRPA